MDWTYLSPQLIPQIDDIYWCHFPEFGSGERLGEQYAPVLIRALDLNVQEGKAIIHAFYGVRTVNKRKQVWFDLSRYDLTVWFDLIIDDPAEMQEVGLQFPTQFNLADKHTLELIWCREFFHDQEGQYPHRIGRLNDACRRRLKNRRLWRRYFSYWDRLIPRRQPPNRN